MVLKSPLTPEVHATFIYHDGLVTAQVETFGKPVSVLTEPELIRTIKNGKEHFYHCRITARKLAFAKALWNLFPGTETLFPPNRLIRRELWHELSKKVRLSPTYPALRLPIGVAPELVARTFLAEEGSSELETPLEEVLI